MKTLFSLVLITSLILFHSCGGDDEIMVVEDDDMIGIDDDDMIILGPPPEYFLIDTADLENLEIVNPALDFFANSQEVSLLGDQSNHLKIKSGYHSEWVANTTVDRCFIENLTTYCSLRAFNVVDTFVTYYDTLGCQIIKNYLPSDSIPDSSIVNLEIVESLQIPKLQVGDKIYTAGDNFVYSERFDLYDFDAHYIDHPDNCLTKRKVIGEHNDEIGYIPFRLETDEVLYIGWIELYAYGGVVKCDRIGYYQYAW